MREVTKRIFTRNGYHVLTAANGPEALSIAGTHPGEIHLLVTDVVMPGMGGPELVAKLTARFPTGRVHVLTFRDAESSEKKSGKRRSSRIAR